MPNANRRNFCWIAGLLALLMAAPGNALATEVDEPEPRAAGQLRVLAPDGTPAADCPLEHTDVNVEVSGFVARVRVVQVFHNTSADPVEAIYTFPLSQRGAVDAMWMRTEGREVRGRIERREEARRIYEAARDRGQLAGLLDEERPNVFTQSVANLMPGAKVEIEIHYVEALEFESGSFEFAFPTVVGPRFVPGNAVDSAGSGRRGTGFAPDTDRVPDASRITPPVTPPGTRAGHDIDIAVRLDAGVPILDIESKLHEIDVEHRPEASHASVRLRRRGEIPNRDFVLRWAVARDQIETGHLVHRVAGEDGFVTFVFVPPKRVTRESAAPKELVFVIDRSGSQSGLPLAKAKETMLWILDHMNPRDTFQVIDFGSSARQLFERPQLATPSMKAQARRYVEALRANGGTMMAEAVRRAVAQPADGNRLRIVTFMTDGYIGNDFEVIELVRSLRGTSRWFPFGTGNSTNRFLLDGMAREGGGEVDYVLLSDPGETVAKRFWERIKSPVLTDVKLSFEGLDVVDVFPRELSDVWAERPLVVHARYRKAGRGRVVVTGYRGGEPWRQALEIEVPEEARDHDALASMWARAKVDDLMRRDLGAMQSGQFPEPLKEKVVKVALAHGLLTPFTSFVAVEDRVVNEGGQLRTVTVPVELPQGVSYDGIFGRAGEAYAAAPMARMAGKRSMSPRLSAADAARIRGAGGGHPSVVAPQLLRQIMQSTDEDASVSEPVQHERSDAPTAQEARSQLANERLAPELRALVERGAAAVTPGVELRDGRVRVRVVLGANARATLEQLEDAGLDVDQSADGWAIGWVAIEDLAALAEVEGVKGVEVP